MPYPGALILAIIVVALAVPAIVHIHSRQRIDRLKRRYRQLTFASPKVADEAMRLQIVRLRNIAPGRSEQWYMERAIRELESGRMQHLREVEK